MPRYYSAYEFDRETAMLDCACGWRGPASEASIELFDALYEVECPRCYARLVVVGLPTHDEVRRAAAAGNEEAQRDLRGVEKVEARWAAAETLALNDVGQLPDLEEPEIVIAWDQEEADGEQYTVLRHGERVLWRELAYWEGIDRFREVAALLQKKYGSRLRGLKPTARSEMYLGGDKLWAFEVVDEINERLRPGRGLEDGQESSGER